MRLYESMTLTCPHAIPIRSQELFMREYIPDCSHRDHRPTKLVSRSMFAFTGETGGHFNSHCVVIRKALDSDHVIE
jgi:hypothetical protein